MSAPSSLRRSLALTGTGLLLATGVLFASRVPSGESSISVSVGSVSELVPTLTPGVRIAFGSADPAGGIYETAGWYPREAGFVWTQGMHHRMLILVGEPFVGNTCMLVLTLDVEGFVPSEEVGPRTLTLRTAEHEYIASVPASHTRIEVPLAFEVLPEAITVEGSIDALNPRSYGSTDGRLLGMRLYSAELDGLTTCGGS